VLRGVGGLALHQAHTSTSEQRELPYALGGGDREIAGLRDVVESNGEPPLRLRQHFVRRHQRSNVHRELTEDLAENLIGEPRIHRGGGEEPAAVRDLVVRPVRELLVRLLSEEARRL